MLMSEVCASDSGVSALWVSAAPLEHEAPASVRQVCGQLPTPLSKSFSQKSESKPFPAWELRDSGCGVEAPPALYSMP